MKSYEQNPAAREYFRQVRQGLVCSPSVRRRAVEALEIGVEEFLEQNPHATFGQLCQQFGSPTEIADQALADLSPAELRRYVRRLHTLKSILLLFITALCCWGLFTLFLPWVVEMVADSTVIEMSEVFDMSVSTIVWLVLCVLFVVVEIATVGLVSIWFAAGALVALLVSVVMDSVLVQMAVFVAVSLLTLLFTRPLVSKYVTPRQQPTNSELNVGKKAQVIRTITPNSPGRVRLEGVDWAARSAEPIAEGSWCIVTAVESATLEVVPEHTTVPV